MKLPRFAILLAFTLLSLPILSHAGTFVMNFDQLSGGGVQYPTPYKENGLALTLSYPTETFQLLTTNAYNTGHLSLSPTNPIGTITLTAQRGGPFTLQTLRLSSQGPNPGPGNTVVFTGTKANGSTVTQGHVIPSSKPGVVKTFSTDFQDVVSVSWAMTTTTYHQFDDITVTMLPMISLSPSVTLTESYGSAVCSVSLSEPVINDTYLTWTLANGTAVQPGDYTLPGGQTTGILMVPAGQLTASLAIPIVNDSVSESAETFSISLAYNYLSYYMPITAATYTIGNDDGNGFAGWMSGHGLTANNALPEADPNHDGVSNIESWLLRINPAGPSLPAWLERRSVFVKTGTNYPALRYTIPLPLPPDVSISLEESTSLTTPWSLQATRAGFGAGTAWSGTGISRITETNTATTRTITMAGSQTIPSRPRAYLRLKFGYVTGGI